jgi:hypothetical protein
VTALAPAALETTAPPVRGVPRWMLPALAGVGPAAIAVLRLTMPYDTADDPATIVTKVMADPGAQSLLLWMGLVAMFTLPAGALIVGRATRPGAPRLTTVALWLLVPGYLALAWTAVGDALLWTGARAGLDADTLVRLYQSDHPTVLLAAAIFVVGHVIGTVLIGVAMWRSGAIPVWAAIITVVSQPLHFVVAVIITSHALDMVAWGMNAVGFAIAGLVLARR